MQWGAVIAGLYLLGAVLLLFAILGAAIWTGRWFENKAMDRFDELVAKRRIVNGADPENQVSLYAVSGALFWYTQHEVTFNLSRENHAGIRELARDLLRFSFTWGLFARGLLLVMPILVWLDYLKTVRTIDAYRRG